VSIIKKNQKFSNFGKATRIYSRRDAARIYGVETREVNQAIKNNPDKFPVGYIVEVDKDELIKIFDKFKNIKNYPGTPKAFTEKGLYMLATMCVNIRIKNHGVHGGARSF